MKVYRGTRTEGGCVVTVIEDGAERPLDARLDLRSHSPTGFEWSYCGSGPAQLALALVADAVGDDERARHVYQAFKRKVVAQLARDGWELSAEAVTRAAEEIERA